MTELDKIQDVNAFHEKTARIRELIAEHNLDAIVLRRNPNLAWFIGGRVHVPSTLDLACLDMVILPNKVLAITNKIEAPRLIAEELPSEVEVIAIDWWEGRDGKLPIGTKVGSDQPGSERIDLGVEIENLRQSLVAEDIARYKKVCSDSAVALGNALKEVTSADREIDVTARIANSLWKQNLELVFIGVAGEQRALQFRHPLPTESPVGNRVVASICARRKGLISSVTRIISFTGDSEDGFENIYKVEAAMFDATKAGSKFCEPVQAAIAAYTKYGFQENEWQKHHQGGPTGFAPRDWPAKPDSHQVIKEFQPIAWNPTGNGWKAEDTVLTTKDGVEILSIDPNWPTIKISGRERPSLLKK